MTYFKKFPLTVYEFDSKQSVVRDILVRCRFVSEHKPYTDLIEKHTIIDGDTPQSLALRYYGSTFYHWVFLLFNEIHNPYYEWPLVQRVLESYCKDKYGELTAYQTKHYEVNGVVVGEIKEFKKGVEWIPPTFSGLGTAVSFYEYEEKKNDERRIISILRPELLGEFVVQFERSLNV